MNRADTPETVYEAQNDEILSVASVWPEGRKMFLPWTAHEIARKLKADPDAVTLALWSLARVGSAATRRPAGNGEPSTWHLTPAGQAEARALFAAEAFAKGGNA